MGRWLILYARQRGWVLTLDVHYVQHYLVMVLRDDKTYTFAHEIALVYKFYCDGYGFGMPHTKLNMSGVVFASGMCMITIFW